MTDGLRQQLRAAIAEMDRVFEQLAEFIGEAELYEMPNKAAKDHFVKMRQYQQCARTQGVLLDRALDD